MGKKDIYNASSIDLRTHVRLSDSEEEMQQELDRNCKRYYYYRNGLLHVRYRVRRYIELSDSEAKRLREELGKTYDKQSALSKEWKFQQGNLGKEAKSELKTCEYIS